MKEILFFLNKIILFLLKYDYIPAVEKALCSKFKRKEKKEVPILLPSSFHYPII